MHTAYKHLDSKLRIAELTIGQWLAVVVGLGLAILWGLYLSPLSPSLTLISSVYLGALPAAAALFASLTEFDPGLLVRSAFAWRRLDGGFAPGPGASARGYTVRDDSRDARSSAALESTADVDLAGLWEGS